MPTGVYTRKTGYKLSEEHKQSLREGKKRFFANGGKPWSFGKKYSEEYKKKLSESHKGQKTWMTGKKHTNETKLKISTNRKGVLCKPRSVESNKKISLSKLGKPRPDMAGSNNKNWKGGITALNFKIRNSLRNIEWKRKIIERDDYTCQLCKKRGGRLHIDHIKPFSIILRENNITSLKEAFLCEELWDINNGRVLCIPCHKNTPTYLKGSLVNIWYNKCTEIKNI